MVYIYDNVTLVDERGRCSTFYNRIGYDQITSHLYLNTISYKNGGKVEHWYIDDPDYSDEPEAEELPLIFKREDVIVRHFETKDAIKDARPETEGPAENVEYKQSNGRHTPGLQKTSQPMVLYNYELQSRTNHLIILPSIFHLLKIQIPLLEYLILTILSI